MKFEISKSYMGTPDQEFEIVRRAASGLAEHFDSVHIFCTRQGTATESGTVNVNCGEGNWFARYGQVREWVVKQEELSRQSVREDHRE